MGVIIVRISMRQIINTRQ